MNIDIDHTAAKIDSRVKDLERNGSSEMEIFVSMSKLMPEFKTLMDTVGHQGMDRLCAQFDGLYRYARILENVATGIASGKIKVPSS